jgi:hypothetical protein
LENHREPSLVQYFKYTVERNLKYMKDLLSILEAISLITTRTSHEPPEDGRKYGPKHVGGKLFKMFLSVLSIDVNW